MPKTNNSHLNADPIAVAPSAENLDIEQPPTPKRGLKIERHYTTPGVHPFEEMEWEHRSSAIHNEKGEAIFQQKAVEVPSSWSQLATDIVVSKYFRKAGVPETGGEISVRQVIHRVAHTIRQAGETFGGYFATPSDADAFEAELTYLLLAQRGAFNSPCFVPGSPVMLAAGYQVPIEEVKVGDKVITHQGRVQRVTETYVRDVEEMLVRVRVQKHVRNTLLTTQNHPVLAIKAKDVACIHRQERPCTRHTLHCEDCLYLHEDIARPQWMPAGALEPGDYVVARYAHNELDGRTTLEVSEVLGSQVEVIDGQARHVVSQLTRWGQRTKVSTSLGLPNTIPLKPEVMRLFGYYLAEGDCDPERCRVRFSLHRQELEAGGIGLDLISTLRQYFNLEPRVQRGKGQGVSVVVHNVVFACLLDRLLGRHARHKTIAADLLRLPDDCLFWLLVGILRGDGCVSKSRAPRLIIRLANARLIEQIAFIMDRLGYHATIDDGRPVKVEFNGYTSESVVYSLSVAASYARDLYTAVSGDPLLGEQDSQQRQLQLAGYVLHRVQEVEKFYYRGPVYNLEVAQDHSYLVNGVAVHNCWFNCGLYHQYGIQGGSGNWYWNFEKNGVVQATNNYEHPQCSACFIQAVEDDLMSIFDLVKNEARVFKYGSGSGSNFSKIRGRQEKLSGGGTSSGLMSFLEVFDRAAGATKSGGTCLAPHQHVYTASGPVPVSELAKRQSFIALSYDPPSGRYKAKRAQAWCSGRKKVVRVHTDKGYFDLSWDHPVRLSTEEYVKAEELQPGTSLFAASVDMQPGYLRVHLRDGNKGKERMHRLVAMDVLGYNLKGCVVHHKDGNLLNNEPENLEVIRQKPRLQGGVSALSVQPLHAKQHNMELVEAGKHIFQRQAFPKKGPANGMHRESPFWSNPDRVSSYRRKQGEILKRSGILSTRQKMLNTAYQCINAGYDISIFENYVEARKKVVGRIPSITQLRAKIDQRFGSYQVFLNEVSANNHRVIRIEKLGEMDVYDVEVECPTPDDKSPMTGHNFVIWPNAELTGSGVVVSNTRRAAKMVCLDMDHPEIVDFINWKVNEEKKVAALIAAGYPADFNGEAYKTVSGQNSNNSVRITDEFMNAYLRGGKWHTTLRTTGEVCETFEARDLMRQIAQAAWACADPGVQFDTTVNDWHTCANTDRIYASNPCSEYMFLDDTSCFAPETRVSTPNGLRTVAELYSVQERGEVVLVTTDVYSEHDHRRLTVHRPALVTKVGERQVFTMTLKDGRSIRATADHRFLTDTGEWKRLDELQIGVDRIQLRESGNPVAFVSSESEVQRWRLLGWLTGDGVFSKDTVALVFGPQEKDTAWLMEGEFNQLRKEAALFLNSAPFNRECHLSTQENGVMQIASTAEALVQYLQDKYGFRQGVATQKDVPAAIHRVADDLKVAYLQGLFSADGCIRDAYTEEEVMLASSSPELLRSIQLLLLDLGIVSRITWSHPSGRKNPQGQLHMYNQQGRKFLTLIGFPCSAQKNVRAKEILAHPFEGALKNPRPARVVSIEPDSMTTVYDITEPVTHSVIAEGMIAHNCNLASINLLKFLGEDGRFDVEGFKHACRIFITAQEILVDSSSYPTKPIAQNSHDYRPLGLGYANLGTLLMVNGIPYDSEEGYAICGAITAIMCGEAYRTSAEIAAIKGPFAGFEKNREPMLRVMNKHRASAYRLNADVCSPYLLKAAQQTWDAAVEMGEQYGYRNSQVTVLAPTGTIGLLMDCDTTGIEPDFALVKFKKLAGGGYFKIINGSVPRALKGLGYTDEEIDDIVTYAQGTSSLIGAPHINNLSLKAKGLTDEEIGRIEAALPGVFELSHALNVHTIGKEGLARLGFLPQKREGSAPAEPYNAPDFDLLRELGFTKQQIDEANNTICGMMTLEGAPHLKAEHLPIFDCANRCGKYGQRYIESMGHVRMIAAAQPFLSGAISKTINMPHETTVEAVEALYVEAWKLGLKAVAIYRDGSKLSQPLSASRAETGEVEAPVETRPTRRRLPDERPSITHKFSIAGHEGYITVGLYEDGSPGEMFLKMSKEGSTISGLMDTIAVMTSVSLQYSVPLEFFVNKFSHVRFEPSGFTNNKDIPIAKSIIDYVFRWLGLKFLPKKQAVEEGDEIFDDQLVDPRQLHPRSLTESLRPHGSDADRRSTVQRLEARERRIAAMQSDAPVCHECGTIMVRNGSCYRCLNCGATSGCS